MSGRRGWQYSAALGAEYIYDSSRDEIIFRDGRRIKRPANIPRSSLETDYDDLDENYATPATGEGNYRTHPGAADQPSLQSMPRGATYGSSPTSNPSLPNDLSTRFGSMSVSGSTARTSTSSSQHRVAFARDPSRGGFVANVVTNTRNVPGSRTTEVTGSEVVGQGGDTETLFPQYKQRNRRFFFVGKVFSMLWSEPAGITQQSTTTQITSMEEGISIGPYGERVYSKIRRFVVIRAGDTYCNALPISTYNGRGVAKRGVNKSEHCIIYTGQQPAMMEIEMARRGENPMRNTAIRVDPDNREDILDPKSRLNFGHPHTIQHNIKAKSCGKVPPEHVERMILQFAEVFGIISNPGAGGRRRDRDDDAEGSGGRSRGRQDDDDEPEDDGHESDDGGDNGSSHHSGEDEEEEDESVLRLREAMTTMVRRGVDRETVLRTTLQSLVSKGLSQDDAKALIRKAYRPTR